MPKRKFYKGAVINQWTVLEDMPTLKGTAIVLAQCSCGLEKAVIVRNIVRGLSKNCGCVRDQNARLRIKHGHKSNGCVSREYRIWGNMKNRCRNAKAEDYKDYGGRGIDFCDRWLDFKNFLEDMGTCPDNLELDRKDNNGNYSKDNCRWASRSTQVHNSRPKGLLGIKGVSWNKQHAKYVAQICKLGHNEHLGYFDTPEEASASYEKRAKELFD